LPLIEEEGEEEEEEEEDNDDDDNNDVAVKEANKQAEFERLWRYLVLDINGLPYDL